MQDPVGVRVFQCFDHVMGVAQGLRRRERRPGQPSRQGLTLQQFRDDVQPFIAFDDIEHADNVLVMELRRCARLTQQLLGEWHASRQLRIQLLQRDAAL